jgi:hypothetical protein
VILRSADGLAEQIKAEAQALLDAGPPPLTPRQLAAYRYGLSDVLDDLEGSTVSEETLFIANQVAAQAADLALALNRRWSGHGKWTIRALRRYDPTLADQLAAAVKAVYCQGDIAPLVRFADNVLASAGGRLFDGYKQSGKQ